MLSPASKNFPPALQKSSVIYKYKCHCNGRYVGKTCQRLQDRIKQYVRKWLIQHHTSSQRLQPDRKCMKKQTNPEYDSAIGQHRSESNQCAANYQKHQYSNLDTSRGRFHPSLLEATYINVRNQNLC